MSKLPLGVLLAFPAWTADETFTLSGTVKFNGPVPAPKPNKAVMADPNCCKLHDQAPDRDVDAHLHQVARDLL